LTEAGHDDYVFAHALVRQTTYEQLGAARRIRLHRQLGEALEALVDAPTHLEALAHHFAQAAADGQAIKAAAYALAAGRSATAHLGYEEAAAHYELGLHALTLSGEEDERRCELLLALGEARWGTGELDQAREAYAQAAELADKLGDAPALAVAALGFCGPHRFEVGVAVTRPVASLLQRALAALGEDDSTLRAQVMGRLAGALIATETRHRAPALARQALQIARRVGDETTLADVLASSLWSTRGPDTVHECLVLARQLGPAADRVGDRGLRALAHWWLVDVLLELGDMEAVDRELEALQLLVETEHERYCTWLLAVFRASQALLRERPEDCERLAHDALAHRFGGDDDSAAHIFGAQMFFVRCEQGRLEELVQRMEVAVEQHPEDAGWRCGLAYAYTRLERAAQARQQLDALARDGFDDLTRDTLWLTNLSWICDVVVYLADASRAQLLYEQLLPYADRCVVSSLLLCHGSVSRPLGLLATAMSRYDDGARHFERALRMNTRIRSPLWIAHTQHDYARMLLQRNLPGDHDNALALLDQALATAEQLGFKAVAEKVRPLRLAAEAAGPAGLPVQLRALPQS
jgi:tetratricopeptide (TPR) repeat protein